MRTQVKEKFHKHDARANEWRSLKKKKREREGERSGSAKNRMTTLELFLEHLVVIFSDSHFLLRKESLTKGSGENKPSRLRASNNSRRQAFVSSIKWPGKRRRSRRRRRDKVLPFV